MRLTTRIVQMVSKIYYSAETLEVFKEKSANYNQLTVDTTVQNDYWQYYIQCRVETKYFSFWNLLSSNVQHDAYANAEEIHGGYQHTYALCRQDFVLQQSQSTSAHSVAREIDDH